MNQLPRILYTKCFKSELVQKVHTLSDTGLNKKIFFADLHNLRQQMRLSEAEVVIKVPIECFAGNNPQFKCIEEGIWENNSPLLMKYISISE